MRSYYAIEIVDCRKKRIYCIKRICGNTCATVNGAWYPTEQRARDTAEALGLLIEKVGNLWEIM